MSAASLFVMRAFYGLNVLGAGRSGLQLLLDDREALQESWGGQVTPRLAAVAVGSMWTSVALTSVAGLAAPVTFRLGRVARGAHYVLLASACRQHVPCLERQAEAASCWRPSCPLGRHFLTLPCATQPAAALPSRVQGDLPADQCAARAAPPPAG